MKKISRKLVASGLSLAFATVALGTTTFAWFTTNATVDANITVGVQQTGDSILISKDCVNWGSHVDYDFNTSVDDGGDGVVEMTAVTYNAASGDGLTAADTFTDMEGEAASASAGQFLQFELFLKISGNGKNIVFNNVGEEVENSNVAGIAPYSLLKPVTFNYYGTDIAGAVGASQTFATGTKVKADAVNALRGVVDVSAAGSAVSDAYVDVDETWNKGQAVNAAFGGTLEYTRVDKITGYVGAGTQPNASSSTMINFGQSLAGNNAANAYIESVLGTNFSDSTGDNYYAANVNYADHALINGFNSLSTYDDRIITTTAANQIYALRFSFWLEGYDADCFDAIFAQSMAINLGFKTVDTPQNNG